MVERVKGTLSLLPTGGPALSRTPYLHITPTSKGHTARCVPTGPTGSSLFFHFTWGLSGRALMFSPCPFLVNITAVALFLKPWDFQGHSFFLPQDTNTQDTNTMTQREQLQFLFDILSESSKYQDSEQDNVRLEVENRIKDLIEALGDTCANPAETHEDTTPSGRKKYKSRPPSAYGCCRVHVDGRLVTKPMSECIKVPNRHSRVGYSWKWVGPDKSEG